MDDALDALVRRVDEDRWLASRFAPARVRARLTVIYALNYEIARTAGAVTQEGIGHIRLAWWGEALDEIHAGRAPRAHPALASYAATLKQVVLPREPLDAMIEARAKDLEAAPFQTWADLDLYLDATAGSVFRLVMDAVAEAPFSPEQSQAFVRQAARAWGYAGLMRSAAHWAARGRNFFPQSEAADAPTLLDRGREAYTQARALAKKLPSVLFPAIGYLALLPRYYKALSEARAAQTPLLVRQMTLVVASATGRV